MWCLLGATPRGQPWTSAVPLPPGRHGLGARRMAVLSTFRALSLGRHVHRELMRSALLDLTPIIAATTCHQRNYVERYSRYKSEGSCVNRFRPQASRPSPHPRGPAAPGARAHPGSVHRDSPRGAGGRRGPARPAAPRADGGSRSAPPGGMAQPGVDSICRQVQCQLLRNESAKYIAGLFL